MAGREDQLEAFGEVQGNLAVLGQEHADFGLGSGKGFRGTVVAGEAHVLQYAAGRLDSAAYWEGAEIGSEEFRGFFLAPLVVV